MQIDSKTLRIVVTLAQRGLNHIQPTASETDAVYNAALALRNEQRSTVDITPNFAAMRERFGTEIRHHTDRLLRELEQLRVPTAQHLSVSDLIESRQQMLGYLNGLLVAIEIVLGSCESSEDVEVLQEVLRAATTKVADAYQAVIA